MYRRSIEMIALGALICALSADTLHARSSSGGAIAGGILGGALAGGIIASAASSRNCSPDDPGCPTYVGPAVGAYVGPVGVGVSPYPYGPYGPYWGPYWGRPGYVYIP